MNDKIKEKNHAFFSFIFAYFFHEQNKSLENKSFELFSYIKTYKNVLLIDFQCNRLCFVVQYISY